MGSVLKIADGIWIIDTGYIRQEFAAIYLVRQGNEIAIIETGTKHSISNIQQALEKDGLSFSERNLHHTNPRSFRSRCGCWCIDETLSECTACNSSTGCSTYGRP